MFGRFATVDERNALSFLRVLHGLRGFHLAMLVARPDYRIVLPAFLTALIRSILGSIIAVFAAAAAFSHVETIFLFSQWSSLAPGPDHIRFLFITVPALVVFIGLSRFFSRGSALFANILFAIFISWRAWAFHREDQLFIRPEAGRSFIAFEWTELIAILLIVAVWLTYPNRSSNRRSNQEDPIV
jgi:hypothetical protein